MNVITLQFASAEGFTSDLIEWYAHGWCCHVDSVLDDGSLLGARLDGVRVRQPDYMTFTRRLRLELPALKDEVDAYYTYIQAQLGKPYDKLDIGAFIFGNMRRRDWRDPTSWFCSELCARALEVSGFVPMLATDANRITPPDLLLLCSALVKVYP